MSTGQRGEERRPGMQTNARRNEHITWLCARDHGTGHCWKTGRRSWVKQRKESKRKTNGWCGTIWAVDGWDTLPSGTFERAKGGERRQDQRQWTWKKIHQQKTSENRKKI